MRIKADVGWEQAVDTCCPLKMSRMEVLLQIKTQMTSTTEGWSPSWVVTQGSKVEIQDNLHLLPLATSCPLVLLESALTFRATRWQWGNWLLKLQASLRQLQVTETQGWQ